MSLRYAPTGRAVLTCNSCETTALVLVDSNGDLLGEMPEGWTCHWDTGSATGQDHCPECAKGQGALW